MFDATVATEQALVTLLWSTPDVSSEDFLLLDESYTVDDLSIEDVYRLEQDVSAFLEENVDDLTAAGYVPDQQGSEDVGHDYVLTRNYHGAGFWEAGPPGTDADAAGERLTVAAHEKSELHVEPGDDGRLHMR